MHWRIELAVIHAVCNVLRASAVKGLGRDGKIEFSEMKTMDRMDANPGKDPTSQERRRIL